MIVTGSSDGTVRLWNPKSGECAHVFRGCVLCLFESSDGVSAHIRLADFGFVLYFADTVSMKDQSRTLSATQVYVVALA